MRVKIFPPHGSDRSMLDERSWAELPEGCTVRDVLRLVRCSPLNRELHDGDVVGFFFPVSGG